MDEAPLRWWVALGHPSARRLFTPESLLLLAVFALALALRLTWVHVIDPLPTDGRLDDSTWYHLSAVSIMEGRGYKWFEEPIEPSAPPITWSNVHGPPTAFWNVGYPLILTVLYFLVGPSVLAAKLLNALLGASTCLLVYIVGKRVFNRQVGLVGALLLALFPGQIFFSTLLMTEVPSAFLLMLLLTLALILTVESVSWRAIVLVGFLLGAASLVRGEMVLLFLPLIIIWAVAHRSAGKAIRYGAVALVAIVAALLPWTLRNWIQLGYPVAISTGSADNLLAGHWSGADGLGTFVTGLEVNEKYADVPRPEREVKVYREEIRRAVDFALHNPAKELELIPKKLFNYYFYHGDSRSLDLVQVYKPALDETAENRLRRTADFYYFAVMAGAVLGIPLWFSLRDPRKLLLVSVLLYYSFMFGFLFIGEPRFHSALVPVIVLFAAAFFVWVGENLCGWWTGMRSMPYPEVTAEGDLGGPLPEEKG